MKAATVIKIASLMCMLSVITGAFAAHALKNKIDLQALQTWETACRYQFYHGLALGGLGILMLSYDVKWFKKAFLFFLIGIIFFCGSLYLLSLRELAGMNLTWLGPITPLGGICFISGWACVFLGAGKIDLGPKV